MLYEVDFMPVGEGERSGNAICIRYSLDQGTSWNIGVIDGGTLESGEKLCEHIIKYYNSEKIDFLVNSHPDQDHSSGLTYVLENMKVKKVIMNCPWEYGSFIFECVNDGRVTKESLKNRLIEGQPYAYKIYELAKEKNIPIYNAFSDAQDHKIPCLEIIGPSMEFYLRQLLYFKSITEITESSEGYNALFSSIFEAGKKTLNWMKN